MCRADVSCLDLEPEPIMMDGELFDPIEHFRTVKATCEGQGTYAERRAALASRVADLVAELRSTGTPTYQDVAVFLNQHAVRTITGKAWSAENVKQFLKVAL